MRARALFSLAGALIAAIVLVSASGAGTMKVQRAAKIDVSTRASVVHYLRSVHVSTKGLVIQRGAHNYAGARCPGKAWACAKTRHTVVQIAKRGGVNRYACSTARCTVVQFAGTSHGVYLAGRRLQSTPAAIPNNTAKCIINTSAQIQLQVCVIVQVSSTANNVAVVYEHANGPSGLTQIASINASITQRASGASNSNTACVNQGIAMTGSTAVSRGSVSVALNAHENATIKQDSAHGGNSASQSATSGGACSAGPLSQTQTETSSAKGPASITQNENAASNGANVTIDIEQNQSTGFLGSAHGANSANFEQDNTLTAIANTPAGPVNQTQSSATGGLLGTVNQDSRDPSTIVATQHETQCEDAATSGLTSCATGAGEADFNGTYALHQTQIGPEGIWKKAAKHGRNRVPYSVHKGVGTATQTGNGADTFQVTQSSKQDNDTGGSGQTNDVRGDCNTSGNCNIAQQTNVDGNQTTNTQSGQNLTSGITCTGSACQPTVPPAPSIDTFPPNPSNSTSAEFTFSDTQAGVTFLCQLDNSGFSPCASPQDYSNLSNGSHTFSVEAKDQNGNIGPATPYTWTIVPANEGNANVLIAGSGDNGSTEPNDNLASLLSSAGYSVSESPTLPADLSSFGQVWWVDINPPSSAEQSQLVAFEQSGKGVFFTGENDDCCTALNTADQSMVNSVVEGGAVTVGGFGDLGPAGVATAMPVNPGVVEGLASDPNAVTDWTVTFAGGIGGVPASSVFAYDQVDEQTQTPVAAAWDRSSTVGEGRVVLFMDINWSEAEWRAANWSDVAENVAFFLSGLATPPTAPPPPP